MDKIKFNIIYKNFATKIAEMKEEYECGYQTIVNKLVDPKVLKCFEELDEALRKQLNKYR